MTAEVEAATAPADAKVEVEGLAGSVILLRRAVPAESKEVDEWRRVALPPASNCAFAVL